MLCAVNRSFDSVYLTYQEKVTREGNNNMSYYLSQSIKSAFTIQNTDHVPNSVHFVMQLYYHHTEIFSAASEIDILDIFIRCPTDTSHTGSCSENLKRYIKAVGTDL